MNYLFNKALYYSLAVNELNKVDFTLDLEQEKIIKTMSDVFCLRDEDADKIRYLINEPTMEEISSSEMAKIHLMAVETLCKNKGLFGDKEEEKQAIQTKLNVLDFVERLYSNVEKDCIAILDCQKEKVELCMCLLATMFISKENNISQNDFAILRKMAVKKENSSVDALMILLKQDEQNREQYLSIIKAKNCFRFRKNELNKIIEKYETHKETMKC